MAALKGCHCAEATRWWRRTDKVEHGAYCAKAPLPPVEPDWRIRGGTIYVVQDRTAAWRR